MDLKLLIAKGLKIILNPPALRKCNIHKTSKVSAKSELTRVTMDRYSYIGNACFMVNVQIGAFCSIADRCCVGGAMHPIERVSSSPVFHDGSNILRKNFQKFSSIPTPKTVIENDVWIGMGCYIKSGVTIHSGAVIGMGSVITHDVPAYEIWAGNPAKLIRKRFDEETVKKLLELAWWDWDDEKLKQMGQYFDDPKKLFEMIGE